MPDLMWVWWVGTVLLCAWIIIEAVVFRPVRLLEWPFLACCMWAYFYGYMAYNAKLTLPAYLGNGMADIGQLMAFLCLIGLIAGWKIGTRLPINLKPATQNYPYLLCWAAGFILILVGAVGNYSVYQAQDEGALNYRTASAYWYLLFYIGYPGLAIAIWATLKTKSPATWWTLLALTLGALVIFIMPQVIGARRGPLYPAIIALLLVPPLTLRRPPNRLVYCGGLIGVGVVMLLFVQVRQTIYNGGSWSEAFQKLDVSSAVVDRGTEAEDNEYVNNCQLIATVYQNGKYQYGTGHLELLVHWVPHVLWPAKPGLGEGNYSFNEMFDDVERSTGVRLLGTGAAFGGVADSFVQYGVLCPFFWLVLATLIGWLYSAAVRTHSPWLMLAYVGFLCASHWLISQNVPSAFVPAMFFELVPVLLMIGIWLLRLWSRPTRRFGPRRVHMEPMVPRAL